jgi:hypothetical protein
MLMMRVMMDDDSRADEVWGAGTIVTQKVIHD